MFPTWQGRQLVEDGSVISVDVRTQLPGPAAAEELFERRRNLAGRR